MSYKNASCLPSFHLCWPKGLGTTRLKLQTCWSSPSVHTSKCSEKAPRNWTPIWKPKCIKRGQSMKSWNDGLLDNVLGKSCCCLQHFFQAINESMLQATEHSVTGGFCCEVWILGDGSRQYLVMHLTTQDRRSLIQSDLEITTVRCSVANLKE